MGSQYFLGQLKADRIPRDLDQLLDYVARVRESSLRHGATWYLLNSKTRREQEELLSTVAAECGLPAKLKGRALKNLQFLTAALGVAAAAEPVLGLSAGVLGAFVLRVRLNDGYVPIAASRIRVFKGQLTWPELLREHRRGVVQRRVKSRKPK